MHYLLTPFEEHFDSGFGAVGDSFKSAADSILENLGNGHLLDEQLPAGFLYRHASELYLKSGILILHRVLRLPFGDQPFDGLPHVRLDNGWKRMEDVHSLLLLFRYWRSLFEEHKEGLVAYSRMDWTCPGEMEGLVREVEAYDPTSAFYRYPMTKRRDRDREKSVNKPGDQVDIFGSMGPGEPYVKAFLVLDGEGEIARAYEFDDTDAVAKLETLKRVADVLHGFHAAMRGELTGGW